MGRRIIVAWLTCTWACTGGDRGRDVRDELRREFEGAYSEAAGETAGQATVSYRLTAAPARVELFEGRPIDVWAYNGQVPGPTLRVRRGQRLRVELENRLPQPTTIHWHGVRVPNSMDGVPGVTQAPVPPGGRFVYEFTPRDAGTFWFHPHVRSSEQVERGLFGVLIVEDDPPLSYGQDVVWVVDDWRLTEGGEIDPRFVTRGDLAHDGRWGQTITVNGRTRPELEVRAGETIRLRLVNTANGRAFALDFGDLDAAIIAVDGMYARRPLAPAGFELAPGNRLDLEISIRPDRVGDLVVVFDVFGRTSRPIAALRVVDGAPRLARVASPARARIPAWERARPVPADHELVLDARPGGEHGIEWTINGVAHGETAMEHGVPHETIALAQDRFAKLRFVNRSARLHPMHIHGVFFRVLSRDGEPVDEGHWRDTVLLHPRETVEIGLVPVDPGRWMLHCHILEHAAAGMMTLVEVRPR